MAAIPPARPLRNVRVSLPPPVGEFPPEGVPTDADVAKENAHYIAVRRYRELGGEDVVSSDEWGAVVKRHHMVVAKAVGGVAPDWLAPIQAMVVNSAVMMDGLIKSVAGFGEAVRCDINTLRGDINTLRGDINTLRGDINTILCNMEVTTSLAKNAIAMQENSRASAEYSPLTVMLKVRDGVGDTPAFAPAGFVAPVFNVERMPSIADSPREFGLRFPSNIHELYSMTDAEITYLAMFYNDDFGIPEQYHAGRPPLLFFFRRFIGS